MGTQQKENFNTMKGGGNIKVKTKHTVSKKACTVTVKIQRYPVGKKQTRLPLGKGAKG